MGKSKKGGRLNRQKSALALLEANYKKFVEAGKDKDPWTTTRCGGTRQVNHKGKTFDQECSRFNKEIAILKEKIAKHIG